jgi:hypothetical protein
VPEDDAVGSKHVELIITVTIMIVVLGQLLLHVKGKKGKAVPLHAMEAHGERGGIAPTHSRPRH